MGGAGEAQEGAKEDGREGMTDEALTEWEWDYLRKECGPKSLANRIVRLHDAERAAHEQTKALLEEARNYGDGWMKDCTDMQERAETAEARVKDLEAEIYQAQQELHPVDQAQANEADALVRAEAAEEQMNRRTEQYEFLAQKMHETEVEHEQTRAAATKVHAADVERISELKARVKDLETALDTQEARLETQIYRERAEVENRVLASETALASARTLLEQTRGAVPARLDGWCERRDAWLASHPEPAPTQERLRQLCYHDGYSHDSHLPCPEPAPVAAPCAGCAACRQTPCVCPFRALQRDNVDLADHWTACEEHQRLLKQAIGAAIAKLEKFEVRDDSDIPVDSYDMWMRLGPALSALRAARGFKGGGK